jgi:hypothetical protein
LTQRKFLQTLIFQIINRLRFNEIDSKFQFCQLPRQLPESPDALTEIEASAAKINMTEIVKLARDKAQNFKPDNPVSLEPAKQNRTFKVHMSYTLEFDIPDGKGGVLYPKGYSFNPLDYVTYPGVLVVIDGTIVDVLSD